MESGPRCHTSEIRLQSVEARPGHLHPKHIKCARENHTRGICRRYNLRSKIQSAYCQSQGRIGKEIRNDGWGGSEPYPGDEGDS
jgi:hypothetical protein